MKVLITGASGFLGHHVVEVLEGFAGPERVDVHPWDRGALGDLLGASGPHNGLELVNPDVVLHLAWSRTGVPGYDDGEAHAFWTRATQRLARACGERRIWFIGVGTGLENDPRAPTTSYLRAKKSCYLEARRVVPPDLFTWIRPYWVVSLPEGRPRIVALAQAAEKEGRVFTPNEPLRMLDFVAVEDVASAVATVLKGRLLGAQDIGSGRARTVAQLVDVVSASHDAGPVDRPVSTGVGLIADVQRLRALGWGPVFTDILFADSGGTSND